MLIVCVLRKGYAPLHLTVENGSKEVMLLLRRVGNVDVKGEDSIAPLHIAAKKRYLCIAKDLLNHGACTHSLTLQEVYIYVTSTKGNLSSLHITTKNRT